jgi:hypothetical protein
MAATTLQATPFFEGAQPNQPAESIPPVAPDRRAYSRLIAALPLPLPRLAIASVQTVQCCPCHPCPKTLNPSTRNPEPASCRQCRGTAARAGDILLYCPWQSSNTKTRVGRRSSGTPTGYREYSRGTMAPTRVLSRQCIAPHRRARAVTALPVHLRQWPTRCCCPVRTSFHRCNHATSPLVPMRCAALLRCCTSAARLWTAQVQRVGMARQQDMGAERIGDRRMGMQLRASAGLMWPSPFRRRLCIDSLRLPGATQR